MIVVDASAVVEALLATPAAPTVEARLFGAGETLHAPHLLDVEVAQVIRRIAARGEIDGARGRIAIADLLDFPLYRYPHEPLLVRVWDLRNNLSAYDAVYVALAEELGVPLITRDRRLAGAAGHRARIELL
ncbi:MAG: type II toxin-antitoxin system VapC family toxin [Alphaproteobacteria bacterium]|nr:type II toxin-antitoxin system VapC family toxin [Alphaproteobacteria bacterium]MBV9017739.1 type II toxin-antitoxin system VapC family toxin [Alphaproteobacteria bacterium]MBV9583970.1 type II toxin-antitoxin system VapC family toxin [Alphaproteobacteria bacterium]MBV9967551.1 type II toxin-antitoxin system VapC family toxin [Alphaproteobacteria bacterium]